MASLQERRNKDGVLISYKVMVYRGRDLEGNILKPYITTFKVEPGWTEKTARKKAEVFAAQYEKECREGIASDARQTFAEYCEYVIMMKEQRNVKANTAQRYRELAERINEHIGYMKIRDIRPDTLNALYTFLSGDGMNKNTGEKLSGTTVLQYHRLIHIVLGEAVREGIIPNNAADRVIPPKVEEHDAVYLQPEEIQKILEVIDEQPIKWKAFLQLMLVTGMRKGEIIGLKWENIDFQNDTIEVERNVQYLPGKGVYVDTVKTKKSHRVITVPKDMMSTLRSLKSWQGSEKMRLGMYFQDQGFLFVKDDGSPINPGSVNKWVKKFSDKYGFKNLHPHSFRHSMASILIFNHADIVSVSRRLGHSKVSTTANIYAHLIEKADKDNSEIIDEAFFGKDLKNG